MENFNDLHNIMPSVLYKYRAWDEYTKQILINHQLYFSDPNDFNDPFDCKPLVTDVQFRITPETKIFLDEDEIHSSSDGCLQLGYDLQKCISLGLLSSNRICCFSEIADSILMWSHYADYHKGLCLIFEPSKDTECFSKVQKILYSEKRPTYQLCQDKVNASALFTKYIDWKYEQEFRIIKSYTEYKKNKSNLFSFKPAALTEIVFGAKTTQKEWDEVRKICAENGLEHVRYSCMHIADDEKYRLNKVPM